MAILDALKAVQDVMITVTGIKTAPDYPGSGPFPVSIAHLSTGTIQPGNPTGARLELHNIVVELHVAQGGSISDAYTTLESLSALTIPALSADTTFSGTLQTYGNLTYTSDLSSWDGVPTVARFFTLNNCKLIV